MNGEVVAHCKDYYTAGTVDMNAQDNGETVNDVTGKAEDY